VGSAHAGEGARDGAGFSIHGLLCRPCCCSYTAVEDGEKETEGCGTVEKGEKEGAPAGLGPMAAIRRRRWPAAAECGAV